MDYIFREIMLNGEYFIIWACFDNNSDDSDKPDFYDVFDEFGNCLTESGYFNEPPTDKELLALL